MILVLIALLGVPAILMVLMTLTYAADYFDRLIVKTAFDRFLGGVSQFFLMLMAWAIVGAGIVFLIWAIKQIWLMV